MVKFTTTIQRFQEQGEKTGWTYIIIPQDITEKLKPRNKQSFRVKGKLDNFKIESVAILPLGGGQFMMAINQVMRKGIGKRHGAMLNVQIEVDSKPYKLNKDFMDCLADDPEAMAYFKSKSRSFQNYYSKWIESAKTEPTRIKRIAQAVNGLSKKQDFGEMLRSIKKEKDEGLE